MSFTAAAGDATLEVRFLIAVASPWASQRITWVAKPSRDIRRGETTMSLAPNSRTALRMRRYRTGNVSLGSGPTHRIVRASSRSFSVAVDPATPETSRNFSYGAPASWMRESTCGVPIVFFASLPMAQASSVVR